MPDFPVSRTRLDSLCAIKKPAAGVGAVSRPVRGAGAEVDPAIPVRWLSVTQPAPCPQFVPLMPDACGANGANARRSVAGKLPHGSVERASDNWYVAGTGCEHGFVLHRFALQFRKPPGRVRPRGSPGSPACHARFICPLPARPGDRGATLPGRRVGIYKGALYMQRGTWGTWGGKIRPRPNDLGSDASSGDL